MHFHDGIFVYKHMRLLDDINNMPTKYLYDYADFIIVQTFKKMQRVWAM